MPQKHTFTAEVSVAAEINLVPGEQVPVEGVAGGGSSLILARPQSTVMPLVPTSLLVAHGPPLGTCSGGRPGQGH